MGRPQARYYLSSPFPLAPRQTGRARLQASGFPVLFVHVTAAMCPSCMNLVVACPTDDQRLSVSCDHDLRPVGQLASSWPMEILQFPYVVDFAILRCATDLTAISQESLTEFRTDIPDGFRGVIEDCTHTSFQGNATPLGNQWLFASSFKLNLQACAWAVRGLNHRLVPFVDVRHAET